MFFRHLDRACYVLPHFCVPLIVAPFWGLRSRSVGVHTWCIREKANLVMAVLSLDDIQHLRRGPPLREATPE